MRYLLLIAALALCAIPAQAADQFPATCSYSDVNTAVAAAGAGDTVWIPSGDCTWTTGINAGEKCITIAGAGTTNTTIRDGVNSGSLLIVRPATGCNARITGIWFQDGGRTPTLTAGIIQTIGPSSPGADDGRRTRIDNNKFDGLNGFAIAFNRGWGLVDNNEFITTPNKTPIYNTHAVDDVSDYQWSLGSRWGTDEFIFLEDNTFTYSSGCYVAMDQDAAARTVFRFNTIAGARVTIHGTESAARKRGGMAMEMYGNTFSNVTCSTAMLEIRSGGVLAFDNTDSTGDNALVGQMWNERVLANFAVWLNVVSGENQWDVNDAGNPQAQFTATGGSGLTVTVSAAGWTPDEWRGYTIRKTSSCTPNGQTELCSAAIHNNTSDTITFSDSFAGDELDFAAGDTFDINLVTHVLDAPGRTGGSDWGGAAVPTPPMGWNDQDTDPIYEWNNLSMATPINLGRAGNGAYLLQIRENEHYYNYTTSFDGTVGVGRGTVVSRPATCTTGVAYWATDEGEWDSTNAGSDGRLYKCTATNTWTLFYTPYNYPHPLRSESVVYCCKAN